jgi:MEMO1 family protein
VSSDLSHWGKRFGFTPYDSQGGRFPTVSSFIEALDRSAMRVMETAGSTPTDAAADFAAYLRVSRNTICGRHALSALLHTAANSMLSADVHVKFVHYTQSDPNIDTPESDKSSVGYGAGIVALRP